MINEAVEIILSKIDEKFKEQAKVFDEKLDKKLEEQAKRFNEKFDTQSQKFEARFDKIESRLDSHDKKLDTLYEIVVKNGASIKDVKEDIQHINDKLEENDERLNYFEKRMTNMERKNDIQVKKLENKLIEVKRDIVNTMDVFFKAMQKQLKLKNAIPIKFVMGETNE